MTKAHETPLSRPVMPPYEFVASAKQWQACLARLRQAPRIAIDLEANSMYAYRERICLIQLSVAGQDTIADPLEAGIPAGFGEILADPAIEKVFHSGEYDLILLKREFDWEVRNLFDTMWAARILGYQKLGLASLLAERYGVRLNKRYQRANWCKRPLPEGQLIYAQADTHYLLRLRDELAAELAAGGHVEEAQEIFAEQTRVTVPDTAFDPDDFWSISGARDLGKREQAVLKALNIFRNSVAAKRDQPLFKIFSDQTLLELAEEQPEGPQELRRVRGMSSGQVSRYGRQLLKIIRESQRAPAPKRPRRKPRPAEAVLERYDRLHRWRKERGRARGVESDVIAGREALWEIARLNPQSVEELAEANILGPWRLKTYGREIVELLGRR